MAFLHSYRAIPVFPYLPFSERVRGMLRRITGEDPIWKNPPFQADGPLFNVIHRLGTYENGLYLTDDATVFLAQTSPDRPAWVWTRENVPDEAADTLRAACAGAKIGKITLRPDMARRLLPGGRITHRMLANKCEKLTPPEGVDGTVCRPEAGEVYAIADMLSMLFAHVDGAAMDVEARLPQAEKMIADENFLVFRLPSGEIAACARIPHAFGGYAGINTVFTVPRFRGHRYAGAVVAALCERIFAKGMTPMLYTDADYPSSNRAYQRIGFVPVGALCTVEAEG